MLTTDARSIIDDPQIDIVVEMIGGQGIAKELIMAAIGAGKAVVTANKALLASGGMRSARPPRRAGWISASRPVWAAACRS